MDRGRELSSGRRGVERYAAPAPGHDWSGGFAAQPQRSISRDQTVAEDWEALHWQIRAALNPPGQSNGAFHDYYANHFEAGSLFNGQLAFARFGTDRASSWRLYVLESLTCTLQAQLPSPPATVHARMDYEPTVSVRPPVGEHWDGSFDEDLTGFLGHLPQRAVDAVLSPFGTARRRPTARYTWRSRDGVLVVRVHVTNASSAAWLWGTRPFPGKEAFESYDPWQVRVWTGRVDKAASEARMAQLQAMFADRTRGQKPPAGPTGGGQSVRRQSLEGPQRGGLRRRLWGRRGG
ncbi:hypothetical protein [Agilicoccus flavus]|uniref:hypothetical protein n=1 Tax=Agilicoccus flavus TaxID=2775968 RepID=UPI001CF6FBE7|nr:hypothetical protein [Agilicoccus flavus]